LEKQLEKFADKFGVLGTHLKNASQSYSETDKLLEKTQDGLRGMLVPAPAETALEGPQSKLSFAAEGSLKKGA